VCSVFVEKRVEDGAAVPSGGIRAAVVSVDERWVERCSGGHGSLLW
jgi:hypothetical protein